MSALDNVQTFEEAPAQRLQAKPTTCWTVAK